MKLKEKLTRQEQKYLFWRLQRIQRQFKIATTEELSLVAAELIFSLLIDPEDQAKTVQEETPFGVVSLAKPEAVEEFLQSQGVEGITDELAYLDQLLEMSPALFFLTKSASRGLLTGSGESSQGTNAESVP
jgi:hypothetical protein